MTSNFLIHVLFDIVDPFFTFFLVGYRFSNGLLRHFVAIDVSFCQHSINVFFSFDAKIMVNKDVYRSWCGRSSFFNTILTH